MSKGAGVQRMFDDIAGRYDLMNRVMTLGQDQRWRRFVVELAGNLDNEWVLDLASGTGDIGALVRRISPESRVVGADFSRNMLAQAARRFPDSKISWHVCDANRLPYKDNLFKAVMFGYLLRNVDDSLSVLKEVYRVMASGGTVVCLDTTPPAKTLLYPFIQLYFRYGIPLLGRMIARDKAAYSYLTGSTMDFHEAGELAALFREAGFHGVDFRTFMMGTIAVHWGIK
ncbi:MAG: ubiquinone/menaquinone biosynthesis methyltransferase [Desulfocapsaceae bacterium]|nr:ubiquinone/menaquinone biosynthesis methyltransferase [Desulfocapsaceae bacterium]